MTTATESNWALTHASLVDLPPVIPAALADKILHIGHSHGKNLRASGRYPVRVLPGLGRSHKISVADLLTYLGIDHAIGRPDQLDGTLPAQSERIKEQQA